MKRTIQIAVVLFALLPGIAKAQWTFDIVSVEAYINDHKKQRSLLLARSTLEYSNKLLHEYSCKEIGDYKELNIDLDKYMLPDSVKSEYIAPEIRNFNGY